MKSLKERLPLQITKELIDMEQIELVGLFLFVLFLLLGTGVWVGFALMGVAVVGIELFTSRPAGDAMLTVIWASSTSWSLTALPLFIWMGEILFRTRLSQDLFKGLSPWMSGLPGGLLHTNIVGCTIFAAVSGSSAATLTTVGKMSIPELEKRNYPRHLIIGTLAGAATLGLMIPPSLTLIVYGVTINESISKLFLAGIVPGLVLASLFMLYVVIYSIIKGQQDIVIDTAKSFKDKIIASRFLIPVLLLVTFVIGSMYSGIATATEAASFGVIGAFILACVQGSMNLETFKSSILGAVSTSAMIALILMGASFLSLSMGFTGLPRALAEFIATLELSRFELLMALLVFYVIIGCFLDGISAVVLTIAIVEPMIRQAGIDIIWFGIFIVVVVEMAQITPPIGFNLFVLQGMTGYQIGYIARTAIPMFLIMLLMIFVLIFLPELATWLPEQMRARP
jgi:tripartite ATP-independent transporter DctM subunit